MNQLIQIDKTYNLKLELQKVQNTLDLIEFIRSVD